MWFFSIKTSPFSLCRGAERFCGDPKRWSCSGASAGGCGAGKERRRRRRRKLLPLLAGLLASSSGRRELRWVIPRLWICPQAPALCGGMRTEAGRGRKAGAGSAAAVLFPRHSSSLDPLCLLVSLGGQEPGARQRVRQEHSAGQEGAGGRLPALREAQRPRGQLHGAVSRRYRAPRGSLGRAGPGPGLLGAAG